LKAGERRLGSSLEQRCEPERWVVGWIVRHGGEAATGRSSPATLPKSELFPPDLSSTLFDDELRLQGLLGKELADSGEES
jgi:hypothetical protein